MPASQLRSFRPRRVLVVDDDPAIRELVATRLDLSGCETREARNGQQAIERIAEFRPEAMVLDLSMPVLDGFGVLSYLRNRNGPPVPTMVLTARHSREDVARCLQLGARDYLAKPFNEGQLLLRVARLLIWAKRESPEPSPEPLLR